LKAIKTCKWSHSACAKHEILRKNGFPGRLSRNGSRKSVQRASNDIGKTKSLTKHAFLDLQNEEKHVSGTENHLKLSLNIDFPRKTGL
jgi:hypothetical protein